MNTDMMTRRNHGLLPSFGPISPLGSLMNSLASEDLFNRGLFSGLRESLDNDLGVRVREVENGREYRFALPGVAKEHINIDIDGDFLIVQAEEKLDGESRFARYRAMLSPEANKETIKAKYVDGLLTIAVEDLVEEKKPVAVEWVDNTQTALSGDVAQNEVTDGETNKEESTT